MGLLLPTNKTAIASQITYISVNNTGGAAIIAAERILQERLLPDGSTIELFYKIEDCVEKTSAGYSLEFLAQANYDVIVATPSCVDGDSLEDDTASYYNIPILFWGTTTLSKFTSSPTALGAIDVYKDSASSVQRIMSLFSWGMFSLIYTQEETCTYFVEELDTLITNAAKVRIAFKKPITNFVNDDGKFILDQIRMNSRIVVLCIEDIATYRAFADAIHKANMDTDEYVFILKTSVRKLDYEVNPIYENDPSAKSVAAQTFLLTIDNGNSDNSDFNKQVMEKMAAAPFNCSSCKDLQ